MNRDAAVILKKPKLVDKDEGVSYLPIPPIVSPLTSSQIIRNTTLTDIKDRLGQAVVSILQTKETFHSTLSFSMLIPF